MAAACLPHLHTLFPSLSAFQLFSFSLQFSAFPLLSLAFQHFSFQFSAFLHSPATASRRAADDGDE